MKIAAISIADYSECTEGMPHDVERLYFRMLLKMLSREGGLPDDDTDNARVFGYRDVRTYRSLKAKLLAWPDAIRTEGDLIVNDRVESDIKIYRQRKAEAVENGRAGGKASGEARAISARSRVDLASISDRSQYEVGSIQHATTQEIKDLTEPSPTPTPSPLSEERKISQPGTACSVAAGGPSEISGLNGSTSLIVEQFANWLSPYAPNLELAHRSVADAVQIYGSDAVRDGFAELKAEHADGKIRALTVKAFYGFVRTAKERKTVAPKANIPPWQAERNRNAAIIMALAKGEVSANE